MACSSSLRLCSLASSSERASFSVRSDIYVSWHIAYLGLPALGKWHRPSGQVTLHVVRSECSQLYDGRHVLDALCDRLDLELPRDPDDRLYHLPVLVVREQVAHKLP